MTTPTFISYLTDECIARQLCKEAGKYAFRYSLSPIAEQLMQYMPPRRYWGITPSARSNHHAQQRIWKRVTHMVVRHVAHRKPIPYVERILSFCQELRHMTAASDFCFAPPTVKALVKDPNSSPVVCRPICTYHNLHEKVLIALLANFLKKHVDHTFHHHSMAYRAPRMWMGQTKVTSNKDAIRLILDWRKVHDSKPIYVAECDISKFFDTLDHAVVKQAMRTTIQQVGICDPDLVRLFDSFVDAFNFGRDVYAKNDDPAFWDTIFGQDRTQDFCFQWIDNPPEHAVGLPQGAALSPLIANMVLNLIDIQTLGDSMQHGHIVDPDLLFIRYCDDIVLMHTSISQCRELITRYQCVLEQHHLCYHPFQQVSQMKDGRYLRAANAGYTYWNKAKSKAPYLWGDGVGNAVRWIGFLGYEISRDGQVRIRKASVATQAMRLCTAASRIRYASKEQKHALFSKFKAKAVGGSTLDGIVADEGAMLQYAYQRSRLEQLKQRFVRVLEREIK